jgi:hypothetical protein
VGEVVGEVDVETIDGRPRRAASSRWRAADAGP